MKLICDASKDCNASKECLEKGMCGHDKPHEEKANCKWPCHASKNGKTGKCVPVKEDEA